MKTSGNPLVSVITATFNLVESGRVEAFRQSVESVHGQTYGSIEHLIIDGASTDGTLELLREYEARGWVKVYSEPDEGIYDAFNKGISRASGKYCAFMNSDDMWHDPRGVETSVHLLELARGDFSYAPATYIDADGEFYDACEPDIAAFICLIPCNHQTMFYRTELLREYRYDVANYRMVADYDLTTRLLLSGRKAVYVPLNFTTFRYGGFSADAALQQEECTRIYRNYYSPLIGEEAAEALYHWVVPRKLIQTVASLVCPNVAEQMRRLYVPLHPDESEQMRPMNPRPQDVEAFNVPCLVQRKWKGPFGLTLLKASATRGRTVYSVLGVLPVLVNRFSHKGSRLVCHMWLFGFLPLWKYSNRGESMAKHYLFHFIPVWSYKLSESHCRV